MAGNITLEVVTPDGSVLTEETQTVVAPGIYGLFGVLPGHTPFLSTLEAGMLRYTDTAGKERALFVNGGFAEVMLNTLTVLADSAERRRDIDTNRAKGAEERARERLAQRGADIDLVRAEAALRRAVARLRVAETRGSA
jgi:F-type H+-transporting ATPase subunit epsilon